MGVKDQPVHTENRPVSATVACRIRDTQGTEKSASLFALVSEVCRAWIENVANWRNVDVGRVARMAVPEPWATDGATQPM